MVITPKMSINSDSQSLQVSEEMKQLLQKILETEPPLLKVAISWQDTPLVEVEKVRPSQAG